MSSRSNELFERACRSTPGGVNSPVRAWKAVGGTPVFVERAEGARIFDVDGNEYVDFCGSWGPMILGHADPDVVHAVCTAARNGTSFGAPTEREVELAERIAEAVPSIEEVRLVSSGTEATMSALRLARAVTRRPGILKFAGGYHGHVDALLVEAGSGLATFGVPDSEGVPETFARATRVATYNDLESVERVLADAGADIAAVVVEPVAGNMGVVPPQPGFLEGLRELTRRSGSLLVFDEVITGFRVARGGAQALFGVLPDLTCLGKVIGGGLPVGAFGGSREIMERLAPLGGVYQAGTLSGNPLATAAGLATLERLDESAYERLEATGRSLEEGLRSVLERTGTRATLHRVGSMWTLFFGVDVVESWEDARRADVTAHARFFHAMRERGHWLPPSQFEAAFVSLAHEPRHVDAFVAAAAEALAPT